MKMLCHTSRKKKKNFLCHHHPPILSDVGSMTVIAGCGGFLDNWFIVMKDANPIHIITTRGPVGVLFVVLFVGGIILFVGGIISFATIEMEAVVLSSLSQAVGKPIKNDLFILVPLSLSYHVIQ